MKDIWLWLVIAAAAVLGALLYFTLQTTQGHSRMTMEPPESQSLLISKGMELAKDLGCFACHSVDGKTLVGPTWQGLYEHEMEVILPDGTVAKAKADEAYIKESILEPGAKIVKGFHNTMPSFKNKVSDEDIQAIIAYIKTLKREHQHP
ncbi:cytochrome c [Candidatus Acetothermia bacterium]|nr:cytochrome c [Candidatus Acetothermia bacterium]MBI3659702.1 cytochrome c [Candidatus Acetothermia bacterium]